MNFNILKEKFQRWLETKAKTKNNQQFTLQTKLWA
jgi:hypothetical protein